MAYIAIKNNKSGQKQVHYCTSKREPGKNNPVQTRKHLGLLSPDGKELILSNKIEALTVDVIELLKNKNISFNGNKVPAKEHKIRINPEVFLEDCKISEIGETILFNKLIEEIKLKAAFNNVYSESIIQQIICVAIFENCTKNPLYRLQSWAQGTPFGDQKIGLSAASMSRLCQYLGENESLIQQFFKNWIDINNKPYALVCDNTSISSYSRNISFLERGYNRDGENLEQVNVTNVFSRDTMLPLYYRLLYGSVTDIKTITQTITYLKEFGIEHFSLALDRGFFSKENLLEFHKQNISFTIGVPCCNNNEAERILDKNSKQIKQAKNKMTGDYSKYFHIQDEYILEIDENVKLVFAAHVYMDIDRQRIEQDNIYNVVDHVLLNTKDKTFNSEKEAKEFLSTLKLSEDSLSMIEINKCSIEQEKVNNNSKTPKENSFYFTISINETNFEKLLENTGMFMIINSDIAADGETTLRDNKSRDLQEKIYYVLKNETGNDRLKVASDDATKGKLFLAFISVILHKALENKMRENNILHRFSVPALLDECNKVSVVKVKDGYKGNAEVPLCTRAIFEILYPGLLESYGIKIGDVGKKIKSIKERCSRLR